MKVLSLLLLLFFSSLLSAQEDIRVLLKPLKEATISSEIAGKIIKFDIHSGDHLKKDQLLVEFDCIVPKAEFNKAKADYQGAYQIYQSNLKLRQLGSYSELELAVARSNMQQTQATRNIYKAQVSYCKLHAPFKGLVIETNAAAHEYVALGQPLLSMLNNDRLEAELFVPSGWLSWLDIGATFNIDISETGKTYQANLTRFGAKVDAVSQSIPIWAEISNTDKQLLSGMSGVAHFTSPPSDP